MVFTPGYRDVLVSERRAVVFWANVVTAKRPRPVCNLSDVPNVKRIPTDGDEKLPH